MVTIVTGDDSRLDLYVGLPDKAVRRTTDLFLAEGKLLVDRLIGSELRLHSLLCSDKRESRWRGVWPADVPMYVCPEDVLRETVGFKLHQGVIAAAYVPEQVTLDDVVGEAPHTDAGLSKTSTNQRTLVVCPEITNVDNLGLLMRIVAGLGADAMLLGPRCNDPWYRRAVRLSMGAVFSLPIIRSADITADLSRLHDDLGYEIVGTALRDDAEELRHAARGEKLAVMFGSEGHGLRDDELAQCDRVVTIPMRGGVDSFNVAVAAGIVLHHFAGA